MTKFFASAHPARAGAGLALPPAAAANGERFGEAALGGSGEGDSGARLPLGDAGGAAPSPRPGSSLEAE